MESNYLSIFLLTKFSFQAEAMWTRKNHAQNVIRLEELFVCCNKKSFIIYFFPNAIGYKTIFMSFVGLSSYSFCTVVIMLVFFDLTIKYSSEIFLECLRFRSGSYRFVFDLDISHAPLIWWISMSKFVVNVECVYSSLVNQRLVFKSFIASSWMLCCILHPGYAPVRISCRCKLLLLITLYFILFLSYLLEKTCHGLSFVCDARLFNNYNIIEPVLNGKAEAIIK